MYFENTKYEKLYFENTIYKKMYFEKNKTGDFSVF